MCSVFNTWTDWCPIFVSGVRGGEDGSHYLLLTQMQPIMQIWYFNQWQLLVLKADWFLFSSSVVNVVLTPEYKLGLLTYKSS